jgi:phosphoserine phosphatase RsbU/P
MTSYLFEDLPVVQTLSPLTKKELKSLLTERSFEKGELIIQEGAPGDSVLFLLRGSVDALQHAGTPQERVLGQREAGSLIGEMSLFTPEGKRTADVRARESVRALELTYANLQHLISSQPEIAFEFLRTITRRLKAADDQAIAELRKKNRELAQAYADLAAAQAELVEKERLEKELEVARQIQFSILPPDRPDTPGYKVGACIQPARAVGGDLFDFFELSGGRIGVSVGDVSDKGVPAAIFMARYCSLLRAISTREFSPVETLERINALLIQRNEPGMFVTAIYGILEPREHRFSYARAGHELPLVFLGDGEELPIPHDLGQPLGIFEGAVIDSGIITLDPGTTIVFNSDGASDATNPAGAYYGISRLKEAIRSRLGQPAQTLCDFLLADLNAYRDNSAQFDDITLVALQAVRHPSKSV